MGTKSNIINGVALTSKEIIIDTRINGIRKRKSFKRGPDETAPDARKRGQKIIVAWEEAAKIRDIDAMKPSSRTVDELIDYYYSQPEFTRVSSNTRSRYVRMIAVFKKWCRKEQMTSMNNFTFWIAREYQSFLEVTYLPKGANNNISVMRMVFASELMRRDRVLEINPFVGIKNLKVKQHEIRFLTPEEWGCFLNCCDTWQRHLFSILYYSGMRTIELRYLEQSRIAPDLSSISISASRITDFEPKNRMRRTIACDDGIKPHLQYFLDLHKGKTFLISGDEVTYINRILKNYRSICIKVKKRFPHIDLSDTNVHTIRKTCGSFMLQNDVPMKKVSQHLGHSSVLVTDQIYAALGVKDMWSAVNSLPKVETFMETFKTRIPATV